MSGWVSSYIYSVWIHLAHISHLVYISEWTKVPVFEEFIGRQTQSAISTRYFLMMAILEGDKSYGLKEKIGKDRGGGSSESRRCRVWVPLIENRTKRKWELHRLLTALPPWSDMSEYLSVGFSLGDLIPGATILVPPWTCCAGLPLFLCEMECFQLPGHGLSLFTPHSGDNLFPLSEKVSGSWTFSASPVTESLRTEFRGKIHSPLEFYGHDIIDFHLLWLPRSLLLFWLHLPPPFWKP